jgi:hypothetical protein
MSEKKIEIKKYAIVDKETGEVVADDAMFIGKKAFMDKGFRKIFVGFLKDVVMNKEIAGKSIRLLLYIIENLKPNSLEIYMSERIICKELEITRATYYNWLKVLIKTGLIEKIDTNLYRLIPYSAVNGQMSIAINKK